MCTAISRSISACATTAQTLTDATKDFAPRVGFGWHPRGDSRRPIRGGYGMYYTQIQSNLIAGYLTSGLDGLTTYTATPGQLGFPTCLTGSCLPLSFDPKTLPRFAIAGARHHHPGRPPRLLQGAVREVRAELRPAAELPRQAREPAQPGGVHRRRARDRQGLFVGADYVHQHWTDLDRTVDLNAPSPFDRTAPGQVRSVAAANATRPILPVNGGVRQVNVLMNLGVADYDGLQTQVSYRGNRHMFAVGQLHALQSDQHHRARRQRHQPEREQHRAPGRGRTRAEPPRPASSRGHHVPLPVSVQHHGRHRDAVRVGASVQRHHRRRQQRRRRRTTIARSSTAVVIGKSAFRGTATSDVGALHRGPHQGVRTHRDCCSAWRASTSSTTGTSSAAARPSTATPARRIRRSASSSAVGHDHRPPSRRSPTSTRRGCSNSRRASSSERYSWSSRFATRNENEPSTSRDREGALPAHRVP